MFTSFVTSGMAYRTQNVGYCWHLNGTFSGSKVTTRTT